MILGLAVAGCSLSAPLREDPKAEGARLGTLPSTWTTRNLGSGADAEYFHGKTKALIAVNSLCDRYSDSKLETLSQDLLSPLKSVKVLKQEDLEVSGRRALYTEVSGTLDGVSVESQLVVLRKNRCLFDFSIFGTTLNDEVKKDFLAFVKGFRFQESSR